MQGNAAAKRSHSRWRKDWAEEIRCVTHWRKRSIEKRLRQMPLADTPHKGCSYRRLPVGAKDSWPIS